MDAPFAVALTLTAMYLAGLRFGASLNPARSFGPVAVSGGGQLLVYVWAPLVDALAARGLYRLFAVEEKPEG